MRRCRHAVTVGTPGRPGASCSVKTLQRDGDGRRRSSGEPRAVLAEMTTIACVKTTHERELKLDVDPGFVLPDLGGKPLAPRTLTSTYYDTPDRRLFRSGITLRRRVENRKGVWQLKLPSEDGRYELEEPGGPSRPPQSFLRLLVALLRDAALEPVAKLRTKRAGVALGAEPDRIEVVVDKVSVLDGNRVTDTFAEVEAEIVCRRRRRLGRDRQGAAQGGRPQERRKAEARRVFSAGAEAEPERGRRSSRSAAPSACRPVRGDTGERSGRAARRGSRGPAPGARRDSPVARAPPRRARARCSPSGPSRSGPSSSGSADCSARSATSTSCSSTSTPRRRRWRRGRARPPGACGRAWRRSVRRAATSCSRR